MSNQSHQQSSTAANGSRTSAVPNRRQFNRQLWSAAAVAGGGAAVAGAWWLTQGGPKAKGVPTFGFEVVKEYPHDNTAFIQGLVFDGGHFYESTGLHGKSSLRRVEPATGKVLLQHDLAEEYFGEGLTLAGDELVQLTWENGIAFVYDKATFKEKRRLRYEGEGWGLVFDGTHFIFSDGTAVLRFLDAKTFRVVRRVTVRMGRNEVDRLNELEYINGEVWANIWHEDGIVRIDPKTGKVTSYLDLSKLWPVKDRPGREDVLNGIAYDAAEKRIFVTGKNWPKIYHIRLVAG